MIDEAHSTGILGKTGRGTLEHFNLKPVTDIDIVMGTFSKGLGSSGGYVVGSKNLIRYLRVAARSYIFSTAMTPGCAAAIIAAVDVISKEQWRREKLIDNTKYLMKKLRENKFNTLTSKTQIIPILVGSDEKAITMSRKLYYKGIFAPNVRWPAVKRGKARLRVTVMSTHTKEQLDFFVKSIIEVGRELNII